MSAALAITPSPQPTGLTHTHYTFPVNRYAPCSPLAPAPAANDNMPLGCNDVKGASPSGQPYRYTGRRLDAQTGLYYYRARYYDPKVGKFLQTDPIGYEDQMNLYNYVGNDPLNAVDPSGMVIKLETKNNGTESQFNQAQDYLFRSKTARSEFDTLDKSETVWTIIIDPEAQSTQIKPNDTTIIWNPSLAVNVRDEDGSGIMSSSLGLLHEVSHANKYDKNYDQASRDQGNFKIQKDTLGRTHLTRLNEVQAHGVESRAARELGEPTRMTYNDAFGTVSVSSPTFSCYNPSCVWMLEFGASRKTPF